MDIVQTTLMTPELKSIDDVPRMPAVEGKRVGADAPRSQGRGIPAARGLLVAPVEVLAAVPTFFVPVCCYDWAEVLKSALGARGRS